MGVVRGAGTGVVRGGTGVWRGAGTGLGAGVCRTGGCSITRGWSAGDGVFVDGGVDVGGNGVGDIGAMVAVLSSNGGAEVSVVMVWSPPGTSITVPVLIGCP